MVKLTPEQLTAIALEVAREASVLASEGYRKHPDVSHKSRTELVTEFDLASERLIRERLRVLTPHIAVVGEEQGGESTDKLTWYCDPIDGTTNFVHGHPFWAVSIGALADGRPIAGAVVAPALALEWTGFEGGPTLRNGEPCRVSHTSNIADSLLATGFPADRTRTPDNNFASFVALKTLARGIRRCGSAALDLCLVADGTYDAYWERKLNVWDVAAGAAMVLGAGGNLTALDGSPANLAHGHILASNGKLHAELVALLA
jgi:myo-inositol-1(or 4)-monophosphatase